MSALLANLSLAVGILLIGVSALLMVVGLIAYSRLRSARLLWISGAFGLFILQGALYTVQAYQERGEATFPALPSISLAVVLVLYIAVLKR